MLRGYRWRKRAGKEYLTRTDDGREMALLFQACSRWWFVLRLDFVGLVAHRSGRADTRKAAMLKAEARMTKALRKAAKAKRTANGGPKR